MLAHLLEHAESSESDGFFYRLFRFIRNQNSSERFSSINL